MIARDDIGERSRARVGSLLRSKWRLDAVIGVGGMASVYAATHRNQSRVAIKMLHPEIALDSSVTTRFLREGYVANTVGHPGTVTVIDDDLAEDGTPFLVMELLDGETLDARLERNGPLTFEEVVAVADQVLDVLAAAHDRHIIHRDIKPENLFVTSEGRVRVLDFGIARLRELSFSTGGTLGGSVLGTPAFMAPEHALGRWAEVDGRTDVWAVGATVYMLLSGRPVHDADTPQEQLVFAATQHARSLAAVVPGVPPELARIVDRALAFERTERWPNARSMQAALRDAFEGSFSRSALYIGPQTVVSPENPGRALTPSGNPARAALDRDPTLLAPPTSAPSPSDRGEVFSTAQTMTRSTPELSNRSTGMQALLIVALAVLGLLLLGAGAVVLYYPSKLGRIAASELQKPVLPVHIGKEDMAARATLPSQAPDPLPTAREAEPALSANVNPPTPDAKSVLPSHRAPSAGQHRPGSHAKPEIESASSAPDNDNPFDRRH